MDFSVFAVADRAAATMLSKQWARTLVEAFSLMNDDSLDITLLLGSAYKSWNQWEKSSQCPGIWPACNNFPGAACLFLPK